MSEETIEEVLNKVLDENCRFFVVSALPKRGMSSECISIISIKEIKQDCEQEDV